MENTIFQGIGKFETFKLYEEKGILHKAIEKELEKELDIERKAAFARKKDIEENHGDRYLETVKEKFRPEGASYPYGKLDLKYETPKKDIVQSFVDKLNTESKLLQSE